MKKLTSIDTIIRAVVVAGAVFGQSSVALSASDNILSLNDNKEVAAHLSSESGNRIFLNVTGNDNAGWGQEWPDTPLFQDVMTAPGGLFQHGSGNWIDLAVHGDENLFSVVQEGSGNFVEATITGSGNAAFVSQIGQGNMASFSQHGTGNSLVISQASW